MRSFPTSVFVSGWVTLILFASWFHHILRIHTTLIKTSFLTFLFLWNTVSWCLSSTVIIPWVVITHTALQWRRWRPKSRESLLFVQPFVQVQIKENIKAPRHWPLWGEFTGDRWIPRTKGKWRGKCFLLMTFSWAAFVKDLHGKYRSNNRLLK